MVLDIVIELEMITNSFEIINEMKDIFIMPCVRYKRKFFRLFGVILVVYTRWCGTSFELSFYEQMF